MMELSQKQQAAFDAACEVVSPDRAEEIFRLKSWENGGCLSVRTRPDIKPLSEEEEAVFKKLWFTLPQSCPWMESLFLVRNHHPAK